MPTHPQRGPGPHRQELQPALGDGWCTRFRASFSGQFVRPGATREHDLVLPIVIVAALGLALAVRWWAVPLVAAGWGVLIAGSIHVNADFGSLALAAVNAIVGAALGIGIARLLRGRPTPMSSPG